LMVTISSYAWMKDHKGGNAARILMMFLVVVDFSRSIYHHLEGKFYFALPANTLLTI